MTGPEHGTYGTAQWHRKTGVLPVCEPCLAAERAYMAAYRSDAENRRREREAATAHQRANTMLRRVHRAEWRIYYAEALRTIRRPEKENA